MFNYETDLQKCQQLRRKPASFTTFAAPILPIYIRRVMELEEALEQVDEIINRVRREG
jgi:hypothetical protein